MNLTNGKCVLIVRRQTKDQQNLRNVKNHRILKNQMTIAVNRISDFH